MHFFEYLHMAWGAIRSNKLRSALTLLGMVIGVFSVIASVTAVKVIDVYFTDTIRFLGSTTFTVQRFPAVNFGPADDRYRRRQRITYEQMLHLRRRSELAVAISPDSRFGSVRVVYQDRETDPNVQLWASDENWAVNANFEIGEGRFLSDQDVQFGRSLVVLGATVAERLFPMEAALGKTIRMNGNRYQVVGVLEKKGLAFGEDQDRLVVAPITTLFSQFGGSNRPISIKVRAPSVELLPATMEEVAGHLRTIRKVAPGAENDFEIVTNEALVSTFTNFTRYLTLGGAGIGLIALLAAGIGIMNIMLVSVTERTREIGIRKAVGARKSDILKQFLLEAIFLCQIGGVAGILLGVIGGNVLAFAADINPAFPWEWAIGGVLGVTVIAILFGVYPAYQAAKLDPIDSLRYE